MKYNVLVTGVAYVDVEADNPKHAEEVARNSLSDRRFGIWDMDLCFVCDEQDLIEEDV